MERKADQPRLRQTETAEELAQVIEDEGLGGGRPVIVLVGGAGGMDDDEVERLADVLSGAVLPALGRGFVLVDGGTDSGVMRAAGRARAAGGFGFELVGVAAAGTVLSQGSAGGDSVDLEPRHSLVILVPGNEWGDESPWIDLVATSIARDCASVTVLANGGTISAEDVERSLARGRPVVVLEGSGRLADAIARASTDRSDDPEHAELATRIARSDLTTAVAMHDLEAVRQAVSVVAHRV